jgi:hypothetical protein
VSSSMSLEDAVWPSAAVEADKKNKKLVTIPKNGIHSKPENVRVVQGRRS